MRNIFSLSICLIFVFLIIPITGIAIYSHASNNYSISDDGLPGIIYYRELTTNNTVIYNFTTLKIVDSRSYYLVETNITISPFLPLNFNFLYINKTLEGKKIVFSPINCSVNSTIISTTVLLDRNTGLRLSVTEHRIITIPQLHVYNRQMDFYFGPINTQLLLKDQSITALFQQTLYETPIEESFQSFISYQSNNSILLTEHIFSSFLNSSIHSMIDTTMLHVTSFNETIDNQLYQYVLITNATNQFYYNSSSFIHSILQNSSMPGFEFLPLVLLLIISIRKKIRSKEK